MSQSLSTLKRISFLKGGSGEVSKIILSNSYCELINFPAPILAIVCAVLTYEDHDVEKERQRIFMQMNIAKSKGMRKYYYVLKGQLDKLGPAKVCLLQDNKFPSGLLNRVLENLKGLPNFGYHLKDARKLPEPYNTFRWVNRPPPMRPYQEEMLAQAEKHERGVFEAAVGSGKTLVISQIIKEKGVNSLVIVPSLALLEQTYRTLYKYFGVNNVQIIKTATLKTKSKLKPIRIVNVQTLASLQKKDKLHKLIEDVDLIAVDEVHHAGAKTYTNLLTDMDHIYFRYGFSGTFLRNDSKTMEMHGFMSNKLYEYPPTKATAEGYLTPTEYVISRIHGRPHKNYQVEYNYNYCGSPQLLHEIREIILNVPNNEQILILVDRKEKAGYVITEFLKEHHIDNTYISGDNSKEEISDAIEQFNEKKIKVLIGTSVIGEGVDVHSTQHLVIATGGKSEIKFVQAVGRCVRLHEGKTKSYVYDFYFEGTNYLEKHLRKRLQIFKVNFAGKVRAHPSYDS